MARRPTRADKAALLAKRLKEGPSFSRLYCGRDQKFLPAGDRDSPESQFRRWARSWVVGLVADLVPEAREHLKDVL